MVITKFAKGGTRVFGHQRRAFFSTLSAMETVSASVGGTEQALRNVRNVTMVAISARVAEKLLRKTPINAAFGVCRHHLN